MQVCLALLGIAVSALFISLVSEDANACQNSVDQSLLSRLGTLRQCQNIGGQRAWAQIDDDSGLPKFFVYVPRLRSQVDKVIIRIPGGPGNSAQSPWMSDNRYFSTLQSAADRCGVPVITLSYTGTAPRQSWPNRGFDAAVADIATWLNELDEIFGSENTIILAESLGAYLVLSEESLSLERRIVLVHPLVESPDRSIIAARDEPLQLIRRDRHFVNWGEGRNGEWLKIVSTDIVDRFYDFGSHRRYPNLIEVIGERQGSSTVTLIYNPYDRNRSGYYESELSRSGMSVVSIPGLDHGFQLEGRGRDRAIEEIERSLASLCEL